MDLEEDIKSEELDNITGSRLVRVKREVREAKKKLRDKVTRVEVPDRMERLLLAGTEPKPDRENNLHKENSE